MDVKYEFGPRFSVRAGAAWALSPIDEQQIFTGLIMHNYKYLTQGRTDLEQLPGYSVDGELDFRDPISGWYLKGAAYWAAGSSFELWLSLQYSGDYLYSLYYADGQRSGDDNHSMSHSVTLSFFPFRSLELDLTCEYYFNKYGADQSLHNYFLDVSAWYFVNSRLQFFIHARNLLDEREYAYSYIGPLETTHYSYRIRPLNILVGAQIKF